MTQQISPAIVISVLALAFTVASFWWLHARPGKLFATAPQQYGSQIHDGTLLIRVPTVLFNTGVQPIIVQTFRLRFIDVNRSHLQWVHICDDLMSPNLQFRKAFVVKGRDARELILQFQQHNFENFEPETPVRMELDVMFANQRRWKRLLYFNILVPSGGFRPEVCVIDLVGGDKTGEL